MAPESLAELVDAILSRPRVLPVGGRTKTRLAAAEGGELLSLTKLQGITEYVPSEYTFTAWAGTPVRDVEAALAEKGQYLPFDPVMIGPGTTLGGTVASGLSGPGRFRFGGVRDFLIGVRLVTGDGKIATGGGKVVKNAAGFDLPKLLVGSLGRLAAIAEVTVKVFPAPRDLVTMRLGCQSHAAAMERLVGIARSQVEADAIEYVPGERALYVRLDGAVAAVWSGGGRLLDRAEASAFWRDTVGFHWRPPGVPLVKIPVTPRTVPGILGTLDEGTPCRVGGGASALWVAGDGVTEGLCVCGDPGEPLWRAPRAPRAIDLAVKEALDPVGRFPDY